MKRLLLLLLCLLSVRGWSQGPVDPVSTEQLIVRLTNQVRARQGLTELVMNPYLQKTARMHSQEMARMHYFDHESPNRARRYPWDRLNQCGADADSVGENLFMATGHELDTIPVLALKNWQLSPDHRANLLDPVKTMIGVGIWVQGRDVYVTQMVSSQVSGL